MKEKIKRKIEEKLENLIVKDPFKQTIDFVWGDKKLYIIKTNWTNNGIDELRDEWVITIRDVKKMYKGKLEWENF